MEKTSSIKDQLLNASLITALASLILMILGFLKNKTAAILLGPVGFGQISILQNLLTSMATLVSFGTQNSVPRQIARSVDNDSLMKDKIWSTFVLFLTLAGAGFLIGYVVTPNLDRFSLFNNTRINEFEVAFGIAFMILSGGLLSILNGAGKIKESSVANVVGSTVGTIIGIYFLWKFSKDGVLLFLIAPPIFITLFCVIKLQKILVERRKFGCIDYSEMKETFLLGFSYLGAALVATLTQLAVRVLVSDQLGEINLGLVSAALAISGSYMAVIVSSVGTNFFPKLSHAIHSQKDAGELIRQQISICFSIGFWILLFCISIPGIVVNLLFSREFSNASHLVQYFVVADFLKILSWVLSYAILSKGFGLLYFANELLSSFVFLIIIYLFSEKFGLSAVGWAAIGRYFIGFLLSYIYCKRQLGFEFGRGHLIAVISKFAILVFVMIGVGMQHSWVGYLGALMAVAFSIKFLRTIGNKLGLISIVVKKK